MSNDYINLFLKKTRLSFDGCFPIDRIPTKLFNRKSFIIVVNTAHSSVAYGHFVTLIKQNGKCILIDPLAINENKEYFKKKCKSGVYFLTQPIQSELSDFCGFYAILWVMYFNLSSPFPLYFVKSSNPISLLSNDEQCIQYIKKLISLL